MESRKSVSTKIEERMPKTAEANERKERRINTVRKKIKTQKSSLV